MLLYLLGTLVLLHAGYSSWEIHKAVSSGLTYYALPTDVYLEVAVGVILFIFAAIQATKNSPFLNKAGELVQPEAPFLKPIETRKATGEFEKVGITPFDELENRVEFIDIQKKRQEYADWAQSKEGQ